MSLLLLAIFARKFIIFHINVWLSFQRLCRYLRGILTPNEQLEQVDTFPYLGSRITADGACTTEFRTRLNRGQAIGHQSSLQKYGKDTAYRFQRRYESGSMACSNEQLGKLDTRKMKKHVLICL